MTTPTPTPVVPSSTVTSILKPGYKTTEFAIVVLTELGIVIGALAGNLPPRYAAMATAFASGAYALARGIAKLFPPKPSN